MYAKTLAALLPAIPNGVVVFGANYALVQQLHHWFVQQPSTCAGKQLFAERQGADLSRLMADYERAARSTQGALLLVAASGRLGEGINFADQLCRCVCVLGLPYPNVADLETKLRCQVGVVDVRAGLCLRCSGNYSIEYP